MLLLFDIGNSQTKIGVFDRDLLKSVVSLSTHSGLFMTECKNALKVALQQANASLKNISGAAIASVVPDITEKAEALSESLFEITPLRISSLKATGLTLNYATPEKLGIDRLCNAVAAYERYNKAVIVVDWGTATKFEVISSKGVYLGGAIAPGLATSASSLIEKTAQLPEVALEVPTSTIGTSTIQCLQSGIMYGCIEMTRGMISRLKRGTDTKYVVIATGGFAPLLAKYVRGIRRVEPYLVLEGARLLYERQRG